LALIGIDFDNTIACYDRVFANVAAASGLLEATSAQTKTQIRDHILSGPDGQNAWMRLQGLVYGTHMADARIMPGFEAFLNQCRRTSLSLCIISHKTETGHFLDNSINLRDVALDWMTENGFFDPRKFGFEKSQVFFNATRADKVRCIRDLQCDLFIDDLADVFLHPDFPPATQACLLAREPGTPPQGPFIAYKSWQAITDALRSGKMGEARV